MHVRRYVRSANNHLGELVCEKCHACLIMFLHANVHEYFQIFFAHKF
jgi:hypothetical protein